MLREREPGRDIAGVAGGHAAALVRAAHEQLHHMVPNRAVRIQGACPYGTCSLYLAVLTSAPWASLGSAAPRATHSRTRLLHAHAFMHACCAQQMGSASRQTTWCGSLTPRCTRDLFNKAREHMHAMPLLRRAGTAPVTAQLMRVSRARLGSRGRSRAPACHTAPARAHAGRVTCATMPRSPCMTCAPPCQHERQEDPPD